MGDKEKKIMGKGKIRLKENGSVIRTGIENYIFIGIAQQEKNEESDSQENMENGVEKSRIGMDRRIGNGKN